MPPAPFPLSGLADEAADDIDGQIAAHKALGWTALELRLLNGKQFSGPAVNDDDFKQAVEKIESAGMRVSSYASAIGNWSRPITGDFAMDLADLRVLIPRMQRTRTKFVRTMSWVRGDVSEDVWRDEGVRRYKEMAKLSADGGIMLLHENCEGWGGLSGTHARRFIESVDHPNVRYLFDIGNTVSYGQETMPFYREILTDLIRNGYKAGVSIEPHVASIVHLGEGTKASPQERFDSYVRYGQGLEKLLADIQSR